MKRIIIIFSFFVLVSACGQSVPSGIIKQDKMEHILYDVHVVDGYVSMVYPADLSKKTASAYYSGIYKKFDTDSVQFKRSLAYYSKNPDVLEKMYKRISARLNAQKKYIAKRDSINLRKTIVADSIKLRAKVKKDSLDLVKKKITDSLEKKKAIKKPIVIKGKLKRKKKVTSVRKPSL